MHQMNRAASQTNDLFARIRFWARASGDANATDATAKATKRQTNTNDQEANSNQ
jgi:hypothetical protein